jgi:hypothetical protein
MGDCGSCSLEVYAPLRLVNQFPQLEAYEGSTDSS